MIDIYNHNPAYAGFDRSLSVNINYRNQWSGIDKNPTHFYANAHLPIYLLNGAVGVQMRTDRAGLINRTEASISYNKVITTTIGTISSGLRVGVQQSRIDGNQIISPDGTYVNNVVNHNDPILPDNRVSAIQPTWTIGLFMRNKILDLGFTISDYIPKNILLENINQANNRLINFYTQIPLIINNIDIRPSILIKTDLNYIQTDLSIIIKSGNIFGGLSLRGFDSRSLDSVVILSGIKLNPNYSVYYSYDIGINDLNQATQGSHELHINYNLNKLIGIGLPPEVIYNPRFL